ncbi:MAG: chemotaxis protein CheV [Magnetococcales bacterium]|nr:chemotaxis protein CheV [Magnetococcales bacterium]
MSRDVMQEVEQRSRLAFSNQMEMLTFYLTDGQQYGINVFKIIEILETPKVITKMPHAHGSVIGAIDFRNRAISVIDLALGLGMAGVDYTQGVSYIIVCEYNNTTQGFLVTSPNKLLNKGWEEIRAPGSGMTDAGYLTAITYDENNDPVQILDVEKILGEIIGIEDQVAEALVQEGRDRHVEAHQILVVDDSKAARTMLQSTLDQLGARHTIVDNAARAYEILQESTSSGATPFSLIISDIEMPGMDGFTFTRQVKANPKLSGIHLVLHSSMSNQSNRIKAKEVGADDFIPKFQPDQIARKILDHLGP